MVGALMSEPLFDAIIAGDTDSVVLLLRQGADPNGWDEAHTVTPIISAVSVNRLEAVGLLLAAGADPNVRDNEGDSPLRLCAQNGYLEMARLLLLCGADKTIHEAGGLSGMNALGLAADNLDVEMVKLLLAHGANPNVQDADRMTVFDHLRLRAPPEVAADQPRLREIEQLLGAPQSATPTTDRSR